MLLGTQLSSIASTNMPSPDLSFCNQNDLNFFSRAFAARSGRPPRIGLVCRSAIADDPRVRRQGDLFQAAGWDVFAIGLSGSLSPQPTWPIHAIEPEIHGPAGMEARTTPARTAIKSMLAGGGIVQAARAVFSLLRSDRSAAIWLAKRAWSSVEGVFTVVAPALADGIYWRRSPDYRRLLSLGRAQMADFWLGSDWTSLPIVQRLALEAGVPYGYDAHEFAVDEYGHSRRWRLLHRPLVRAIERKGARGAAFVVSVSEGIAKRLMQAHALSAIPTVVRNIPTYEALPFRPAQPPYRILYHGLVSPGRGLENCITAMALLPAGMTLTIRGPAAPTYRAHLEDLARSCGASHRIIFATPVPMVELVARANEFDIGIFAIPNHSEQNTYVLPNKFFEYVMAGLALCVSDLPEMTQLVGAYGLGETIRNTDPSSIATALARLDTKTIEAAKKASLRAARELCWEVEARKLLVLVERAVTQARTPSRGALK